MLLINPYRFAASRFISNDADVVAYVLAVESADGQQLESGVISAYDSFIAGCKTDGIWTAIKASCILAGARTLSGALVPLVGNAPTNLNFVSADYNRESGLKGNGSTKYLRTNKSSFVHPIHAAFFATEKPAGTFGTGFYLANNNTNGGLAILASSSTALVSRVNSASSNTTAGAHAVGFTGINRTDSNGYLLRGNSSNFTVTQTTGTLRNENYALFGTYGGTNLSTPRIAFYSIGESLDLALLEARVSTLMTDLAAAIP